MFINKKINVVCFGEVLFDVFGEDKKIGGAPLNLALRTASFGFPVAMISAVGNDEDGKVICDYIKENQVDITKLVALNDVVFSNSMAESSFRMMKPII